MNLHSLRQGRTLTKEAGLGRKGSLKIIPSRWLAIVLLVMAFFFLLRVYRQKGPAPDGRYVFIVSARGDWPGGSPNFIWKQGGKERP
jgi:hypothetical protein